MLKVQSKRRRTKQQMDEDRQRAEQEQADIEEKLQRVAELEAMQAERDQLRAEKAQFQRQAQTNAEQAAIHRAMQQAGLVGKSQDGTWAIRNGQSLKDVENQSKGKAQLLNVEKRE